ncbi:bifunctional lysylphosphatidylglycerol synthetase/lysine--tRNA ligase LysX [Nonomuraea sediminis]|uniref:bifunctional lysylphosphatidylglycerol synthetase/lysine--tRNA ligase LysX n=1 Tax=Nonomuraea sediminis TaxID=2835864 RepID=UPI001BDC2800|nr:bifunctional lysylphosphatidylglycerol synthetase/lysine--tRNA ligase LysX [Nonomuraea sediminis]
MTARWGWVPRVLAGAFAVVAVYSAVIALVRPLRLLLQPITTAVNDYVFPVEPNLAYAVFMALLAGAIARRKRVAYRLLMVFVWLSLVLLVLFGALTLIAPEPDVHLGPVVVSGVFTVVLLVVLLLARREFYAKVQRASFRKALLVLAGGLLVSLVVGYGLITAFPGTLRASDHFQWVLEKVFGGALTLDFDRQGHGPAWVSFVIGLISAIALLAAAAVFFRSQRATAELPPGDEIRMRQLLAADGERDSLGYFATRRDRAAIFSPSGKSAISYRVVAGVSLAGGDPIGDVEAWEPAIRCWLDQAREYGWTAAAIGASEEGARAYDRAGLKVLQLGDEAVVRVAGFSLQGRDMRGVRQAVHRVRRAGYTLRVRRHADLPQEEMRAVMARADAWRDTETERGFSMALGRLGDPADGRCVLVEALTAEGDEAAVLSFVPWGEHGLSLDLMRRDRESDNGLMEFMVTGLVEAAPKLGVDRISLNFAVFRAAFEQGARIGAGPVLRAWRSLLLFFSRWWQLESLYRSNVKYRPEWVPRFLAYADTRDLPKVGIASAIAEGFLAGPSLPTLLRRGAEQQIPAQAAALLPEPAAEPPGAPVKQQVGVRTAKLGQVAEPYPVNFARTHTTAQAVTVGEPVAVAGRVMLIRDHGGVIFVTLRDWAGERQLMLTDPATMRSWRQVVDLGDHVGCRGRVTTSAKGEVSVLVEDWTLTAKCLHPLPDKHLGLSDPEARVRQRHLDLITDPRSREVLRLRAAAVQGLRDGLIRRGFLEVETPILQPVHGGANARPFHTHINVYDLDLYLRIAPELYLKRLCVGGVERVFELGRTFRNEGVSYKHNPEFTMLEAYQAYADYRVMLDLARELIQEATQRALGGLVVQGVDISGEWPAIPVNEAISHAAGEEVTADTSAKELSKLCDRLAVPYSPKWGRGQLVLELYERLVEEKTVAPTFYLDFPADVSPLTRPHRDDPRLAERWDLVAFGAEIGTAYSELVDPVEQRRRLTEQSLRAAGGDPEAMEVDEDFLGALEYAMPPTGGLGLGVDRLVMLLTGASIRQTVTFPLVRPMKR